MRLLILPLIACIFLFGSCKIFKKAGKNTTAQENVNSDAGVVAGSDNANYFSENKNVSKVTKPAKATRPNSSEKVSVRSEQFSFDQEQDQAANANKKFFVILGSFSQKENSEKAKDILKSQGFKPYTLVSETGNFRICVDAFNVEAQARERVIKIRTDFPQYVDAWLLYKK
ncbi:MAG: SPOR domain-containing protein [Bacteroidota bacterium]|nr:SPOR domain-containing protein [Bacteroidota bacterium]MDP4205350.1 SPOR domain-containing protein [Bacteroidota bacterium]